MTGTVLWLLLFAAAAVLCALGIVAAMHYTRRHIPEPEDLRKQPP